MPEDRFDRELVRRLRQYESRLPADDPPDPGSLRRRGRAARATTLIPALAAVALVAAVLATVRPNVGEEPPQGTSYASSNGIGSPQATADSTSAPDSSSSQSPPAGIPGMTAFDGSPGALVSWCWDGDCGAVPIDFDHSERYAPFSTLVRTDATITHATAEGLASADERDALQVTRERSEIQILPSIGGDVRIILVSATFPDGDEATYAWRAVRGVIVGANADHEAIIQPLIETRPNAGERAAEIAFTFDGWSDSLGIEGAILFLKATDPRGNVVLDRMVDGDGDLEPLPPGDYTLIAYYRSCDGDCSLLDPANDFCAIEATLDADERYRFTVTPDGCTLR